MVYLKCLKWEKEKLEIQFQANEKIWERRGGKKGSNCRGSRKKVDVGRKKASGGTFEW